MTILNRVTVLFLVVAFAGIGSSQTLPPSMALTISTKSSVVKSGAKIRVQIEETNKSAHDILRTLPMPTAEDQEPHSELAGLKVEIADASGKEPPLRKWGRTVLRKEVPSDPTTVSGQTAIAFPLHSGESRTGGITVSNMYDLGHPGKYTIWVQGHDDQGKGVKSNTITITVTP